MARILIVDASISGHHETYLFNIARGLSVLGDEIFLAIASENKENASIRRLAEIGSSVKIIFVPLDNNSKIFGGLNGDILRERAYWNFNRDAYKAALCLGSVDHIVLPYADCCLHAMSVMGLPFGSVPVTAITMRPIFHHQSEGVDTPCNKFVQYIKKKMFENFLSKSNLSKVLTIDPTLKSFATKQELKKLFWRKVNYFPDPVKEPLPGDKLKSRTELGLASQLHIVLLYGAVDVRKGVEPLLRALSSISVDGLCVILAGVMAPSIRRLIQSEEYKLLIDQGRLIVFDKYISEHDEHNLLVACDMVWLGYVEHFSMSGVLVKAAQYGRPVIASRRGLLGWFARDLPGSIIIDVNKPDQVQNALHAGYGAPGEVPASMLDHNWNYALRLLL